MASRVVVAPVVAALREPTPYAETPKYSRYQPRNRVPCDHCLQDLADNGGAGPMARAARTSRRTPGAHLLLCTAHADFWREQDKLPPVKHRAPSAAKVI